MTIFAVQSMSIKKGDVFYPLEVNGVKKAIVDRGHEFMNAMNDYFLNPAATAYATAPDVRLTQLHALMITAGFMMDTIVLSLLAFFSVFGSAPT